MCSLNNVLARIPAHGPIRHFFLKKSIIYNFKLNLIPDTQYSIPGITSNLQSSPKKVTKTRAIALARTTVGAPKTE